MTNTEINKIKLESIDDINKAEASEGKRAKKYTFYLTPMDSKYRVDMFNADIDAAILKAIEEFQDARMGLPKKFKRDIKNITVQDVFGYNIVIDWTYAPITTIARCLREAMANVREKYGLNLYNEDIRSLDLCYTAEPIYTDTED